MIKIVFFYNQYDSGWSETYYAPGSDPVFFARTLTSTFMQNSVAFRSASTVLKAIRLTRVEPPRFSFLVRPYPVHVGQRASTATEGPDVASTDAVISLYGSFSATRRVFMRGLFDGDTVRDAFGVDLPTPILNKGIALFVKGMVSYNFAIRSMARPPNAGLVWQNVATVAVVTNDNLRSEFTCTTEVPNFAVGSYVSFVGVPGSQMPGFPRTARIDSKVLVAGRTDYKIAYSLPGGVTVKPRAMMVTNLVPQFESIENFQFERFSEHKTGRPFGSLRGRSRSRSVRA